jgi:hypothetical protein
VHAAKHTLVPPLVGKDGEFVANHDTGDHEERYV